MLRAQARARCRRLDAGWLGRSSKVTLPECRHPADNATACPRGGAPAEGDGRASACCRRNGRRRGGVIREGGGRCISEASGIGSSRSPSSEAVLGRREEDLRRRGHFLLTLAALRTSIAAGQVLHAHQVGGRPVGDSDVRNALLLLLAVAVLAFAGIAVLVGPDDPSRQVKTWERLAKEADDRGDYESAAELTGLAEEIRRRTGERPTHEGRDDTEDETDERARPEAEREDPAERLEMLTDELRHMSASRQAKRLERFAREEAAREYADEDYGVSQK